MEDVLRWSLVFLGSCVIAAVLAHGLWVSRKNSNRKSAQQKSQYSSTAKQEYQPGDWHDPEEDNEEETTQDINESKFIDESDNQEFESPKPVPIEPNTSNFDDLGLSAVKVVAGNVARQKSESLTSAAANDVEDTPSAVTAARVEPVKMYKSVVTQPKPQFAEANKPATTSSRMENNRQFVDGTVAKPISRSETPQPPPSLLKKQTEQSEQVGSDSSAKKADLHDSPSIEKVSLADQARNLVKRKKIESAGRKRREPKFAEDQMRIDFDEGQRSAEQKHQDGSKQNSTDSGSSEEKQNVAEVKQEVLVLNVKTADDQPIPGSALLPMLLTLGFKFGDQDIFHRHVTSNGKGPVLFSLANMFKPGNFDIDNLENFVTQGVSLFMILPIEGDPHQVFNMMHNAARKIADEFSAQIYDGRRTLLTKQSLQQYVEKIREFERQRAIYNK
ncbi:MAG: cell division protein ZipA [Paraglaciecola sp.]|jgi:cell division protein ZipA